MTLFTFIEILGTLAFAISGIRLASAKRFDWFGAYVVGFTTAIGGGTLRDLMLSLTPFWMLDSSYLVVTAFALGIVVVYGRYLIRLNNTLFSTPSVWGCSRSSASRRRSAPDSRSGWRSSWARLRAPRAACCATFSSTRSR